MAILFYKEFPMRNFFLYKFPKSIIIVFFLSSFIFSQNMVTVKGTIFDAQTMSRLSGANLIVEELGRGTTSDENGHFLLSSIPEGEFIIVTVCRSKKLLPEIQKRLP
jgi:hypothetical protein